MVANVRKFVSQKMCYLTIDVDREQVSHKLRRPLGDKTSRTLALFVLISLMPYLAPKFHKFRPFHSTRSPITTSDANYQEPDDQGMASSGLTGDAQTVGAQFPADLKTKVKPGEIEDPSGHALDRLFSSLMQAEAGNRQVRIEHYGDSPITNDGITSTVRRELQLKFGDAGHGFILIAKPWGWYGHIGVTADASPGWEPKPMFISQGDHLFGLGGACFSSSKTGARATFGTTDEGKVGHAVSSFDIYYLAQPDGGDFDVSVDGNFQSRVQTAGSQPDSGFFQVKVPNGAHSMTLSAAGNGAVRLYGVVLQSDLPGVQYDSLGVNGAYVGLLAHYMDQDHWIEQLRHRNPDLVILNYGTNESQFDKLPMDQYIRDTKEVIRRIRAALPQAAIMLVSPMDRGMRGEGGDIVTRPSIPRLVSWQRAIAAETGCAFFDTYTAMGGEGTVAKWIDSRPKLMGGDYTHPTAQGAEIVGGLISTAILNAYQKFKDEQPATSAKAADGKEPMGAIASGPGQSAALKR
jgi:lysophospholipase L1-like esterase